MRSRPRHVVGTAALALFTPFLWSSPAAAASTPYDVHVGYGCPSYPNAGWSVNDGWGTWNGNDTLCGGGSPWTYPNGSTAHSHITWWAKAQCDAISISVAVDIPSWSASITGCQTYTVTLDDLGTYAGTHVVIGGADARILFANSD